MAQPLRFSRFEVLQHPDGSLHVLGEGGEVTIYLARERESGAAAVLRVPVPAAQKNPSARHRFLEEAREMAAVKHPHVAAVIHSSDTSAGAFCAMEFCDGVSLQDAIEEVGALPWQEAFRLAMQLASALEVLDQHGLVHRGLRARNIVVTTGEDNHAHLKITEYGRVAEEMIRDTIAATKSGFIQTPAYASPEEFLAVAPPDARSLQYALGAVLWYCLTGRPMFEGTQFEVMFQHVNTEPAWNKLPSMPGPLVAVMRRLLAKSAADRFATPAALSAALRAATAGVTTISGRTSALDASATTGPTALAWLKARQTLMLDEVHPLLAQTAAMMDAAAADGAGPVDAALERVVIEIEGWGALPESQRAALLRTPLVGWPTWKLKLVRVDAATSQRRAVIPTAEFVRFCHRLLTGQGKGVERHVPTAALSPEGNAFFERHLGTEAARGLTCRQAFALLCEAEEVSLSPDAAEAAEADPLATRVVRPKSGDAAGTSAVSTAKQQEEQAWLARERETLERAKRDLSAQEAERARRHAEEQAHVEKLRRSLEDQQKLLEEKRREQQRLEQELQLRAQLEFQKLQEEARTRESQLQHKREAAEQALRQREADFRAREQERFAKLEQLKRENNAMEERVQEEFMTLRHVERRQSQRSIPQPTRGPQLPSPPPPPPLPAAPAVAMPTPVTRRTTSPTPTQPVQTHHQSATGSIVLARLAPMEVQHTTRTTERPLHTAEASVGQGQKLLVTALIALLVLGVLALIAAAALTIFSGNAVVTPEPTDEPIAVEQPPTPPEEPVQHVSAQDALRALIKRAETEPGAVPELRAQVVAVVTRLADLPAEEAAASVPDLRKAAETWRLPEAWLALAALEPDEDTKLDYYLQAGRLGSKRGSGQAGRILLEQGVRIRHAGAVQQAVAKLSEAIAAGDPEAMLVLGNAMYRGQGLPVNPVEGRALIQRAANLGHEPAREWLRKNAK